MITYIIIAISFLGLYISIIWFNFLFLGKREIEDAGKIDKNYTPKISIAIPAYNEAECIEKTIISVLAIDYPRSSFEVIVVDDGSTDSTSRIARKYKDKGVKTIKTKNMGKGHALNIALSHSSGELFACVDADSEISKDSVRRIVQNFKNKEVGGCSSSILIRNQDRLIEKVQAFEYMYASIFRRIYSFVNCMYVTPGVLSVYRKKTIEEIGYFDDNDNITEDLEIALRLHDKKKRICFDIRSITKTDVPSGLKELMRQRVRWYRGYIHNALKYKHMHLNKEFGVFGMFMLPLNIISTITIITTTTIGMRGIYEFISYAYERIVIAKTPLIGLFELVPLKQTLLTMDLKISLPILIITIIALYILHKAYQITENKPDLSPKSILAFVYFTIIFPWMMAAAWVYSIWAELRNDKRTW